MTTKKTLATLAGAMAALLSLTVSRAEATLIGDTVSAQIHSPDLDVVESDLGQATVGAGTEFSTSAYSLDIGADTLTITFLLSGLTTGTVAFNGPVLADLTSPFTSASLASTTVIGITSSDVFLLNSQAFVNLANISSFSPDDFIVVNLSNAPVPEPGTFAMLGLGLAGIGYGRKKRLAA